MKTIKDILAFVVVIVYAMLFYGFILYSLKSLVK